MSLLATAATVLVLTIRVYDVSRMPPEQRQMALDIAAETLAEAGVEASWLDCTGAAPSAPCVKPPVEGELILRIQREPHRLPHVLGTAIVQDDGPSVVATVYDEAIALRSDRTGIPKATILGRVAAHEIGHLLLGRNSHSPHGLMRPTWDIKLPHPSEWRFSRDDVATIRGRMEAKREAVFAAIVAAGSR
jgi:hypothetical protein